MVTRLITKQYTIVGYPNYLAAKASANALITQGGQYWRSVAGWQIIDNGEGQAPTLSLSWAGMPVADCTPVHTAGCMWQVDVNVNERQVSWTFNLPANLSTLFPSIVPSQYDEPTAQSRMVSAEPTSFGDAMSDLSSSSVTPTTTSEVEP